MKLSAIPRLVSDHGSEIGLLALIAAGSIGLCFAGLVWATAEKPFDPSAYLVVLTLIVGAIKERWTQRTVDRMGQQLGQSVPQNDNSDEPQEVTGVGGKPVQTQAAPKRAAAKK